MRRSTKITVGTLFLLVLIGLGAGEAYMLNRKLTASVGDTPSAAVTVVKAESPNVQTIIAAQGSFTAQTTTEPTFLENVVPSGAAFERIALLHDGAYAGTLAWTTSPDVKMIFMELKEALLPSFSPDVTDLKDETFQDPGYPVRNVLSFRDPSLGPDAFVLIRVRDRLYEAHVAAEKQEVVAALLRQLSE
jgi:hypothetical protein